MTRFKALFSVLAVIVGCAFAAPITMEQVPDPTQLGDETDPFGLGSHFTLNGVTYYMTNNPVITSSSEDTVARASIDVLSTGKVSQAQWTALSGRLVDTVNGSTGAVTVATAEQGARADLALTNAPTLAQSAAAGGFAGTETITPKYIDVQDEEGFRLWMGTGVGILLNDTAPSSEWQFFGGFMRYTSVDGTALWDFARTNGNYTVAATSDITAVDTKLNNHVGSGNPHPGLFAPASATNFPTVRAITNLFSSSYTLTNINERPVYLYMTGTVDLAFSSLRQIDPIYLRIKGPDTVIFPAAAHFVGGWSWQTNMANHFLVWQTGTNLFVQALTTSED